MRAILKVERFSHYISTVKEARLVQRKKNAVTTKWRLEINKIPISMD
ncbi:MAG: hypothetical protein HY920_02865 [Elusimicrobia bacterium]|nr:hypothetical protein [Elusimicrobiota bacterium]